MLVDLWVSIPAYELEFNGVSRTVLASNKLEEVKIFLDFSIPIMNSTEQILDIFRLNSGNLIAVHGRRRANRRFVFKVSTNYYYFLIYIYIVIFWSGILECRKSSEKI